MDVKDVLKLVECLTDEKVPESTKGFPEKVLIRTVTHYHVGRIVEVNDRWIILDEASWVADTGRFHYALTGGVLGEVEPFPNRVWINVGAVIDMTEWKHDLPESQK